MELGDDCSCDNPAAERRRVRSGGECNGGVDTRRRRLQRRRRARRRRLQVLSGGRSDAGTADRREDRGFAAVFVRSGGEMASSSRWRRALWRRQYQAAETAAAAASVAAATSGPPLFLFPSGGERGGENLDRGSLFLTLSCHGDVPST